MSGRYQLRGSTVSWVAVCVLCLLLLILNSLQLVAGINSLPALRALDAWQQTGYLSEKRHPWPSAMRSVSNSIRVAPWDSEKLAIRASLYEWRAFQQRRSRKLAEKSLNAAIDDYTTAIRLRPASAIYWSGLARNAFSVGDHALGNIALIKAMGFGPWDVEVMRQICEISIANWSAVNEDVKGGVGVLLDRAMRTDTTMLAIDIDTSLIHTASKHNWLANIRQFTVKEHQHKLVNRLESQRQN